MSAEEAITLSKSARKRANKKARESEEAAEEPPAPQPKAAAKEKAAPKAKAAQPPPQPEQAATEGKAKAKGKAKAEPKGAAAAPAPAAPKAEGKAKAKGKAEPKPAAEAPAQKAEPAPASKAAAKPAGKAGAKAKAKAKAEPEPEEPKTSAAGPLVYTEVDDGSRAGDWEVSTGTSKKAQRRKEVIEERKTIEKAQKAGTVLEARGNQHIPGLAPVEAQLAAAKGGAKAKAKAASQSVAAIAVVSAAAADNKDKAPEKAAAPDNNVSVNVKVPEAKIGRVVGPKGSNVNLIKEKTGVKTIDMSGDVCTILGPPEAVTLAEHAVRQLIEKGYMSLAFEDFEEEGVPLHPQVFPDIIGSKGVIIQEIKKQAKVEVDIPPVPKNGPAGKKYKVTLAGSKASVALGKEILNSIAMYGHHELIHPGVTHKEMEIEPWRYAFLIGSKGSEMRHIQNNYKVRVNIPREHSECQNVVIVGEPRDIERAVKYIEKVIYESEQPRGRGAPEKATDDGGDDGEIEDWMKPYMYQRK